MQCNATNFLGWLSANFPGCTVFEVRRLEETEELPHAGFEALYKTSTGLVFRRSWFFDDDEPSPPNLIPQPDVRFLLPERESRPVESWYTESPVGRSFSIHIH